MNNVKFIIRPGMVCYIKTDGIVIAVVVQNVKDIVKYRLLDSVDSFFQTDLELLSLAS
jgi:hypothetical protein